MKLKKMISKVMAAAMVLSAMSMGTMVHAEETVELTFMGWEASPLETKAVEDGIAAFEAEYPNIKVTYTPGLAGAEYNAKILTSAAAGALPDVMFVAAESYRQIAGAGLKANGVSAFGRYLWNMPELQHRRVGPGKQYLVKKKE